MNIQITSGMALIAVTVALGLNQCTPEFWAVWRFPIVIGLGWGIGGGLGLLIVGFAARQRP